MSLLQELWTITAPRPGTNSSFEPTSSVKGSRINSKLPPVCPGGWEESLARGSPRKHGESIQTAFRRRLQAPSLGPLCPEVTLSEHIKRFGLHSSPNIHHVCVRGVVPWSLCVCKHLACVSVQRGMSGASCATERVSTKQRAVRQMMGC